MYVNFETYYAITESPEYNDSQTPMVGDMVTIPHAVEPTRCHIVQIIGEPSEIEWEISFDSKNENTDIIPKTDVKDIWEYETREGDWYINDARTKCASSNIG